MLSKKTILLLSVVLVSAIAYLFYSQGQTKTPPKQTTCEILISDLLDVKTKDERDFVLERWRLLCDKDNP